VSKVLDVGDRAYGFSLPAAPGGVASLKDFAGKPVVLFFYPKDDTTACTKEALAFSALQGKFRRRGVSLLGISRDTVARHEKFIAKYDLKVQLASDETGEVCEAYGVWVEKSLYGRKYMGIERSTFLIGADGRIASCWRKVKVEGHVEDVLASVA
jgi:peroxiredoxin Q/BCP